MNTSLAITIELARMPLRRIKKKRKEGRIQELITQ
jgi:hypothetical protein